MARRYKFVAGFDGDVLGRLVARRLGARFISLKTSRYPAGESFVTIRGTISGRVLLVRNIDADPASAWHVSLAGSALKAAGARSVSLLAPWIAYGRQDRSGEAGETLAALLRSAFRRIYTVSPHSRMFTKYFRGRLTSISAHELMADVARRRKATAVAAPDAGAKGRAKPVARRLHAPIIVCRKTRTGPGSVRSLGCKGNVRGARILFVDDMVDSGGTLRAAAEKLKHMGAVSLGACITHAADPKRIPSAKNLGLAYLVILYPRKGKPSSEFLGLLAKSV